MKPDKQIECSACRMAVFPVWNGYSASWECPECLETIDTGEDESRPLKGFAGDDNAFRK